MEAGHGLGNWAAAAGCAGRGWVGALRRGPVSGEGGACTREAGQTRGRRGQERRGGQIHSASLPRPVCFWALQARLVGFPPGFPTPGWGARRRTALGGARCPWRLAFHTHILVAPTAHTSPLLCPGSGSGGNLPLLVVSQPP